MSKKRYESFKDQIAAIKKEMAEVEKSIKVCTLSEYKSLAEKYSELSYKLEFLESMSSVTNKQDREAASNLVSAKSTPTFRYSGC